MTKSMQELTNSGHLGNHDSSQRISQTTKNKQKAQNSLFFSPQITIGKHKFHVLFGELSDANFWTTREAH